MQEFEFINKGVLYFALNHHYALGVPLNAEINPILDYVITYQLV